MPRIIAAVPTTALLLLAPHAALAQPEVPDGFTIRRIAPLLDGVVPQLSAIDDARYGSGVVSASLSTDGGVVTLRLIDRAGVIRPLGVYSASQIDRIMRVRHDAEDLFEGHLHITLGVGPASTETRYLTVDPDGAVSERWRRGSSSNEVFYDFDFVTEATAASAGLIAGVVLLDQDRADGTRLADMDRTYGVTVRAVDSVPPGRNDTDVQSLTVDVTGRYGGGVLVADSDDDDDICAIYELRNVVDGGSYRLITDTRRLQDRFYGDLAIAAAGPFGGTIYVTEQRSNQIQTVDEGGTHTTWATGFTGIDALSISPDGESMYAADQSGVWLIRPTGTEPGPVVLATDPSTPTGSTLSGAPVTSLRIIFNEPVGFTDADVTITDGDGNPVGFDASGSGSQFMLIGLGAPLDGDAYTVVIADSVRSVATGEQLDGDRDGVAGGDAELVFTHACAADFDGDGSLTIFDFLAFQNAFAAGCP